VNQNMFGLTENHVAHRCASTLHLEPRNKFTTTKGHRDGLFGLAIQTVDLSDVTQNIQK
jgi:hypothetical protein